jgi:acetyl esterase/lipase
VLDCGAYDLGLTPSALAATNDSLVLTRDWIHDLLDLAVSGRPVEQRRVPQLSPALADPTGMPSTLFTVGDLDPLRDDTLLMAGRWQLAGVPVEADVWPEAAHAFTNMATPLGMLAAARTVAWITDLLDRDNTVEKL